jgi:hypothetical protein
LADEARARAVVGPFMVPGLAEDYLEWREVGGAPAVLVRQRSAEGEPVELWFIGEWLLVESAAVDAVSSQASAGPTTPPEAVTALRRQVGWQHRVRPFRGGWVVIQGPQPAERLGAFLDAAGVGGPQ